MRKYLEPSSLACIDYSLKRLKILASNVVRGEYSDFLLAF